MIDPAYHIPELYDLKTYGKTSNSLIEIGAETLLSFITSPEKKRVYLDINHPDGDAIGSSVNLAILFQMTNVPYSIDSHNSSYKLTFSVSRLPLNDMKVNLERDVNLLYIGTDFTPLYPFWEDVEEISKHPKAKEKIKLMIIDHHPFIGREEAKKIREMERETECLTYLNLGHSSDANIWWKGPNIPCAGEITFRIVSNVLEKLNKYNVDTLKHFLIPTLLATYTDLRTRQFIASIRDEKIGKIVENYTNVGMIKEYQGFVTHFDDFINIFNGAIRYAGLKVGEEQRTYSLTEIQKMYSPTHKLLKSAAAHVMLSSKINNPMILTRHPKDLGYEYENGYHLLEILQADKEWEKIKPIARNAFLHYHIDHYVPRSDRVSYFNDTKSFIAILPKSQTIVSYRGIIIDLSKLLKYPPYIEYFFTAYSPIADSGMVRNSSLIIVGVESSRIEDYSEFSFRSNSPSIPAGHFASEIANRIRKEIGCPYHFVFGGGHEVAAGLRIRQSILDMLKRRYDLDVYSLINELIKNVRL